MSTKMKSTMPADSSSASAKLTGPSAYSSNRPRYRSGGSQASKFIGKTKEMNGKIFDIGAGQGTKYLATQEELAEYVARTNPKGHRASTAIATLTPIAYSYPEEPTGKAADGIADLPEIKQKLQIFRYESEQKKVDKMKIEDDGIMQNAYWIAYGQCSEPLRNELDTESAFPKISQDGDVIGLLKMIKQLCYNFQSHKYGPQAIHDAMRKFEMLQQDQHQSTSDYLKKFTASVDVIDSVGATVGVHKSLVDEEMHQLQAEYTAADEAGKRGIYEDCQAKAREKYLATAYLMGADRKRYGTMLTEMENNYSRGYDQWPKDMVKAHMLLVNWKADTRRATGGLQQTALSYVATGQGQGEQGGRGGGGGRGSPRGPGRGAGGRGGGNPNWICHLCGDQGHRHLDCPQREAVAEFLKSQTHAQIEDDTADATTEVSTITDATGLGDVAKNMFDKISRSDPRKAVNMLQNMIRAQILGIFLF